MTAMNQYLGKIDPTKDKAHYMYSPYYGVNFIDAFVSSRAQTLKKLECELEINAEREQLDNSRSIQVSIEQLDELIKGLVKEQGETSFKTGPNFVFPDCKPSTLSIELINHYLVESIAMLKNNLDSIEGTNGMKKQDFQVADFTKNSALRWLERLLNSFEITKSLGKSSQPAINVECFVYFSIALSIALFNLQTLSQPVNARGARSASVFQRKYFKLLNGLLKINDVIVYAIEMKFSMLSDYCQAHSNDSNLLSWTHLSLRSELDLVTDLLKQKELAVNV